MSRSRWIAVFALLGGCGGDCSGGGVRVDRCDQAGNTVASSLEIGIGSSEFMAVADGDVVPQVFGPQGGAMIGVSLRLRGDVAGCLGHETAIYALNDDMPIDLDSRPRNTYAQEDGSFTTHEMFMILGFDVDIGDQVRIRAEAGGQMAERTVYVEQQALSPDAGGNSADAAAMLDASL